MLVVLVSTLIVLFLIGTPFLLPILTKSERVLDVNFFLQILIQKCRLDVHLKYLPLSLGYYKDYQSNYIKECYKSKFLIIVYSMFLFITFDHQPCLVFLYRSLYVPLGFIYPFDINGFMSLG